MSESEDAIDRLTEILEADTAKDRERIKFLSLLAEIVDALPEALIVTDDAGTVILFNARAEHCFGYHRTEVIGQAVEMLLPPEVRQAHVKHRGDYAASDFTIFSRLMGRGAALLGLGKNGATFPLDITLNRRILPSGTYNIALARRSAPTSPVSGESTKTGTVQ